MISKKYSSQYKIEKVTEYLEENKKNKITKAEFAARNNISDSTFNDWVIKYQRDKQGFCNVTNEVMKLEEIAVVDREEKLIQNYRIEENANYTLGEDYLRLHYNGAVVEFNKVLLEKVLAIVKRW